MRVSVIGAGYVGLVNSVGWCSHGHHVTCIDSNRSLIHNLKNGKTTLYEPGLEQALQQELQTGRLDFQESYGSVAESDVIFIAVSTPSSADGSIDLSCITSCSQSLAAELAKSESFKVIAVRSTVIPGTTEGLILPLLSESGKKPGKDFGLAMIPEFLREGIALEDFSRPDRIVAGISSVDLKTRKLLEELHSVFRCPLVFTSFKTAELVKYASNSFLATRISFANEMSRICEKLDVDVDEVMAAVGMDKRIGPHFLKAGPGFGGSCLPKDVKALVAEFRSHNISALLLDSVLRVNEGQKLRIVEMLKSVIGPLQGKKIAVLGLSFKPETDDIRESSSVAIIRKLLAEGAAVKAYDPRAMEKARSILPAVELCNSPEQSLSGVDAALLVSAWPEFQKPAGFYSSLLKQSPLFDAQRMLDPEEARKAGLAYYSIGRGFPWKNP